MNFDETLALFAQGRDAWNAWANSLLAKKIELQVSGQWETAAWAEFSTYQRPLKFETDVDFKGWVFPGNAVFESAKFFGNVMFEGASFGGDAQFGGAQFGGRAGFTGTSFARAAWFEQATFSGVAGFTRAMFGGKAGFEHATFQGVAGFAKAKFEKNAGFNGARFNHDADFGQAKFGLNAEFENTKFVCCARFAGAAFSGPALFNGTKFGGDAQFSAATFKGTTSFVDARFQRAAGFDAVFVRRSFTLADASFKKVPDFIQANFKEAPRLDDVRISPGYVEGDTALARLNSRVKRLAGGDRDVPARWRALKRLAIQGHDLEREQLFFPKEIRSARYVTDWPLPFTRMKWSPPDDDPNAQRPWSARIPIVPWRKSAWTGFFRFWFGILYQLFSDFGRSILRPAMAFLVVILIFAAAYLDISKKQGAKPYAQELAQNQDGALSQDSALSQDGAAPQGTNKKRAEAAATPNVTNRIAIVASQFLFKDKRLHTFYRCREPNEKSAEGIIVESASEPKEESDQRRIEKNKKKDMTSQSRQIIENTNALAEAFQLSWTNGSVFGGIGDPDSARRMYGCLYGFTEDSGNNSRPVVPRSVSAFAIAQKSFSLIFLFLIGLAIRNMLKVQ